MSTVTVWQYQYFSCLRTCLRMLIQLCYTFWKQARVPRHCVKGIVCTTGRYRVNTVAEIVSMSLSGTELGWFSRFPTWGTMILGSDPGTDIMSDSGRMVRAPVMCCSRMFSLIQWDQSIQYMYRIGQPFNSFCMVWLDAPQECHIIICDMFSPEVMLKVCCLAACCQS